MLPRGRYRHSSTKVGGSIFIFGGVDKNQNRFSDFYEFAVEKREWRLIYVTGQIPSARTFHQLAFNKNSIFLFGGNDGCRKNDLYELTISSLKIIDCMWEKESRNSFNNVNDKAMFLDEPSNSKVVKILKNQIYELENRLFQERERNKCKICSEIIMNCVFMDCGHRFCCFQCSSKIQSCLLCKKIPKNILKIFTV